MFHPCNINIEVIIEINSSITIKSNKIKKIILVYQGILKLKHVYDIPEHNPWQVNNKTAFTFKL